VKNWSKKQEGTESHLSKNFTLADKENNFIGHFFMTVETNNQNDTGLRIITNEMIGKKQSCIWFVHVSPILRGKGYGKELMKIAKNIAKNDFECDVLSLFVGKENTTARKVYEKSGFQYTGSEWNRWETDWVEMSCQL
jgi:ribosomal protein S18 acetylase RimI-like enzyme